MTLEVRPSGDRWGLFLGNSLIGESKHRYDADFAKQVLMNWKEKTMRTFEIHNPLLSESCGKIRLDADYLSPSNDGIHFTADFDGVRKIVGFAPVNSVVKEIK